MPREPTGAGHSGMESSATMYALAKSEAASKLYTAYSPYPESRPCLVDAGKRFLRLRSGVISHRKGRAATAARRAACLNAPAALGLASRCQRWASNSAM